MATFVQTTAGAALDATSLTPGGAAPNITHIEMLSNRIDPTGAETLGGLNTLSPRQIFRATGDVTSTDLVAFVSQHQRGTQNVVTITMRDTRVGVSYNAGAVGVFANGTFNSAGTLTGSGTLYAILSEAAPAPQVFIKSSAGGASFVAEVQITNGVTPSFPNISNAPAASETALGMVRKATDAQATSRSSLNRYISANQVERAIRTASQTIAGKVRYATDSQRDANNPPTNRVLSARQIKTAYSVVGHTHVGGNLGAATTTTSGTVEYATNAERDQASPPDDRVLSAAQINAVFHRTSKAASTGAFGLTRYATNAERDASNPPNGRVLTALQIANAFSRVGHTHTFTPPTVSQATASTFGTVRYATAAERDQGSPPQTRVLSASAIAAAFSRTNHNHDGRYARTTHQHNSATMNRTGPVRYATDVERDQGSPPTNRVLSARQVNASYARHTHQHPQASQTVWGLARIATAAERDSDPPHNNRVLTPRQIDAAYERKGQKVFVQGNINPASVSQIPRDSASQLITLPSRGSRNGLVVFNFWWGREFSNANNGIVDHILTSTISDFSSTSNPPTKLTDDLVLNPRGAWNSRNNRDYRFIVALPAANRYFKVIQTDANVIGDAIQFLIYEL